MLTQKALFPILFNRPKVLILPVSPFQYSDTSGLTTYTFAACNFGPERPNRRIVCIPFNRGGSSLTYVSGTIGGFAATTLVPSVTNGTNNGAGIIAKCPTGTINQTITITWSGATNRCGIGIWSIYNLDSDAAYKTVSSTASPPTGLIDVPANGGLVAAGFNTTATTDTWTGVLEDYDAQFGTNTHSGGSINLPAGEFGRTLTSTFAALSGPVMIGMSFGPNVRL